MKAKWNISNNDAFVCSAEDIKRIARLLESLEGRITWTMECADHVERSGNGPDLENLLDFDNAPSHSIQSVDINTRSHYNVPEDQQFNVSVRLGSRVFSVLSVSIDGHIDLVERVRSSLESALRGLRAWYWRFASINVYLSWMIVSLMILLVVSLALVLGVVDTTSSADSITSDQVARMIGLTVTFSLVVVAVLWTFDRLRERLFPRVAFTIGQGKQRHEIADWTRKLIIGLVSTGLIGVAVSVLFS